MRLDRGRALAALELLEAAMTRKVAARKRARLEAKLQAAMAKAFRAQGRAFVRELGAVRSTYPIAEAARWGDWAAKFDKAVAATVQLFTGPIDATTTSAVLLGAKAMLGTLKASIGFDLANPRAVAWLAENPAAERVTMITETTRGYIAALVDRAVEDGASYSELARRITDRYEEMAAGKPQLHIDSRAHLIAVTEVGEAYSAGNLMAGQALEDDGIPMEKAWDTVGDGRVSDGCDENAAAGWLPLADAFPSGHQRPLRFPGCRCDLLMRAVGADDDTTPTTRA
jgi:hypothetical protein